MATVRKWKNHCILLCIFPVYSYFFVTMFSGKMTKMALQAIRIGSYQRRWIFWLWNPSGRYRRKNDLSIIHVWLWLTKIFCLGLHPPTQPLCSSLVLLDIYFQLKVSLAASILPFSGLFAPLHTLATSLPCVLCEKVVG